MSPRSGTVVIGAGVTGVAAGATSGAPVLERAAGPGGICRSYYMVPGSDDLLTSAPRDRSAYRFEVGGGHWIFGGDPATLDRLRQHVEFRTYERDAVVRIGSLGLTVPYPFQANIDALGPSTVRAIESEMAETSPALDDSSTLGDWLLTSFGQTLCELFFRPFHDRYTAGLTDCIAPQDAYKTPGNGNPGYNRSFCYPVDGLDQLAQGVASRCDVRYGHHVIGIDPHDRTLLLADGSEFGYERLISTLPLHVAVGMAGLRVDEPPDPYTSVLVLNIGGERGEFCPSNHWQYEADSHSGFHRIGFYSNVEPDFLPADRRAGTHVSMYVERAFAGGHPPTATEIAAYASAVTRELIARGYLRTVEVIDPSWVDVAYTWRTPGSRWRDAAVGVLAAAGITQVGRYGRWQFQGIADSIREGFAAGELVAE